MVKQQVINEMVDLNLPQLFPQTKLPPKGRYIPLEIEYEANFESKLVLRKLILQIKGCCRCYFHVLCYSNKQFLTTSSPITKIKYESCENLEFWNQL